MDSAPTSLTPLLLTLSLLGLLAIGYLWSERYVYHNVKISGVSTLVATNRWTGATHFLRPENVNLPKYEWKPAH